MLMVVCLSGCSIGDPAQGQQALADLTPIEADILADKFVDQDEANQATDVLKECLRDAGFTVYHHNPLDGEYDPSEIGYGFSSWSDDPESDEAEMDLRADACHSEINAVSAVWVLQTESFNRRALPGLAEALEELQIDQ